MHITVSDTNPWLILAQVLFRRRGNAYKMHSATIKAAIDKKLQKYRGSSKDVILLLDGWFGGTHEILDNIRQHDQVFLQEVGFDEI